jgi:rhodanese-related sulfurtransferase
MKYLMTAAALLISLNAFADTSNKGCADEAHYPLVTKTQLKGYVQAKNAFIIDVNSADSYKTAHVPGAIHFESHEKDFAQVLPKDHNALIVAYCGGTMCSAWKTAAEKACNMGYTNIQHFKEGISGWTKKD